MMEIQSNVTEVREDTKGDLIDEVQMSRERENYRPESKLSKRERRRRTIGYFVDDFEKKKEIFRYTPKYRIIRLVNGICSSIIRYFRKND